MVEFNNLLYISSELLFQLAVIKC